MKKRLLALAVATLLACSFAAVANACNTNSMSGSTVCDPTTGTFTVTWTAMLGSASDVPHWSAGIAVGARLNGLGTGGGVPFQTTSTYPDSDAGTVVSESEYATAGDATGNLAYASVTLPASCKTVPTCKQLGTCPKPCTVKNGCVAHYAPRASFIGPYGDPFYKARFDNRKSNRSVQFTFRYFSFVTNRYVTIRHTVRAHHEFTTKGVHVLGFSFMTIRGHGKLLAAKHAAAPGNYGSL